MYLVLSDLYDGRANLHSCRVYIMIDKNDARDQIWTKSEYKLKFQKQNMLDRTGQISTLLKLSG